MIESINRNNMKVRTRIAPSPTGENLHIGNAYTALINYVFAKQNHGQFIVRIEDTDRTRLVDGSENRIIKSLEWLGIIPDESPVVGGPFDPYRQSERLTLYKKYASDLIDKGYAYYCFCSPERLSQMREKNELEHKPSMYDRHCRSLDLKESRKRASGGEKYVIRMKVPDTGETVFQDLIRGEIKFDNKLIDDQVLIKSDGFPTYHLAVVVDDHLMEISHIIRGEEWISSTPKHILLYDFLGWDKPVFAHMPLLRNTDKSKLSKRKNPVWASWYKEQGFLPEAVINYLATLAWSHPQGNDIFTLEEMAKVFDLSKIQTTAPIFNTEKLRWMNGEYLRKTQNSKLITQIFDFYQGKYPEGKIEKILPLVKERMKTFVEFETLAGFFFQKPHSLEKPVDDKYKEILGKVLSDCIFTHDDMEKAIRKASENENLKAKDLFMILRIIVTGKTVGPPLLESMVILGKDEVLDRLNL